MYVKPRRLGLTWFRLAGGVGGYAAYVCQFVVLLLFDLLAAVVRLRRVHRVWGILFRYCGF